MVDGAGEGACQERVHGHGALRLVLVGVVVGVEAADTKEIDDLHVALFLRGDERADHLLFLFVGIEDIEVEGDTRFACLSANVHEAVYAGGVVGKIGLGVNVVERYARDGVDGLKVEVGLVGVAVEDERSAVGELKVFVNDLLEGKVVGSALDAIGAEETEGALVVVVGKHTAAPVEGYLVTRLSIHEEIHRGAVVDVEVEVDKQVRTSRGAFSLCGRGGCRLSRSPGLRVLPAAFCGLEGFGAIGYEWRFGKFVGRGDVVGDGRAALRGGLDADVHETGMPFQGDVSRAKHRAVEGHVAKVAEVVGKHVPPLYGNVVGHVLEVVVAEAACHQSRVLLRLGTALRVVEAGVAEIDVSGLEVDAVVLDVVAHSDAGDGDGSLVDKCLAFDVDTLERAENVYPARCPPLEVVKDARSPLVDEIEVYALRIHVEVEAVVFYVLLRRDVALHMGAAPVGRVCDFAVHIDGVGLSSPVEMHVEVAHRPVVQGELGDAQVCVGLGVGEERVGIDVARGFARKFHGMEVDEREDVLEVHLP